MHVYLRHPSQSNRWVIGAYQTAQTPLHALAPSPPNLAVRTTLGPSLFDRDSTCTAHSHSLLSSVVVQQ